MTRALARRSLPWLAALALVAACGGAQGPRVSSPFTESDAEVFDDAVDRLSTPADLPEGFRERWQRRLCRRSARSDVVAVVTIPSVRADTNPDRRSRYRIVARVERQLHGEAIDELVLPVREDDPGYETVHGRDDALLEGTYVAYVKWYHRRDDGDAVGFDARIEDGEGDDEDDLPVDAHWHLSPASEQVLEATERALEAREGDD